LLDVLSRNAKYNKKRFYRYIVQGECIPYDK